MIEKQERIVCNNCAATKAGEECDDCAGAGCSCSCQRREPVASPQATRPTCKHGVEGCALCTAVNYSYEAAQPAAGTTPQAERPKFDDLCDRCITATHCILDGCCLAEARAVAPVETPEQEADFKQRTIDCAKELREHYNSDWDSTVPGAEFDAEIIRILHRHFDHIPSKAPVETRLTAEQFLAQQGLADLSLYWPTGKPLPKIDYESKEAAPTLLQLLEAFRDKSEADEILTSVCEKCEEMPAVFCRACGDIEHLPILGPEVERIRQEFETYAKGPKLPLEREGLLYAEYMTQLAWMAYRSGAKNEAGLREEIERLRAQMERIIAEADFVISGGDDDHDRCTECGLAGIGMLRDALNQARRK